MIKRNISHLLKIAGKLLCFLFIAIGTTLPVAAQPVLSAENISLGGGGTAYLSGVGATFWNPANLAINDRYGNFHINLGHTGILYEPVLSSDAAGDQFFNFTDSFYPYQPSTTHISSAQRETILEKNYPRNSLLSQHQTRADIILGGVAWQHGNETYSVAARARFSSRIEVGRGWYSSKFISSGDGKVRDFTLNQHINQLMEFSVGYAREFTFINGLMPRLSKLYIGIAPKLVLAGPSFDARYHARYIRSDNGTQVYAKDFSYSATGQYSSMTNSYLATGNPQAAINQNLNRKIKLQNTGYGAGLDFGLTYLIPLGDDLSIIERGSQHSIVKKSLRFSFSLNDLGIIRYDKNLLELSSPKDTVQIGYEAPKQSMFIGSGGQYLSYFEDNGAIPNPITNAQKQNSNNYTTLLPTSMNAGVLIDLSRVKVMGDLTLGLNNTAFTSTKLTFNVGLEARPVEPVPIRLGARLAAGSPTHVGLGTGIETRYWDLSLGAQVILRSRTFTSEFVGGAFAGIQFHF